MVNEVVNIVTIMGDSSEMENTINTFMPFFHNSFRFHPMIYFDDDTEIKSAYNNKIKFWTVDYTPYYDLIKISKKFPHITLRVEYADEDLGVNVGVYYLENGEMVDHHFPEPLTVDAYKMSIDITGDNYYITEFIETLKESESDEEFPKLCIELAYNERVLSGKFPIHILEHFEKLAVRDEDYEFASTIVKEIKRRCQNT